jgi:hypothetical protein
MFRLSQPFLSVRPTGSPTANPLTVYAQPSPLGFVLYVISRHQDDAASLDQTLRSEPRANQTLKDGSLTF